MKSISSTHSFVVIGVAIGLGGLALIAQDQDKSSSTAQTETNAKPLTKKEIARKQKQLEKELAGPWKKWMD